MNKLVVLGIVALAALVGVAAPAAAGPFDPIAYADRVGGYASCAFNDRSPDMVARCGTPPLP